MSLGIESVGAVSNVAAILPVDPITPVNEGDASVKPIQPINSGEEDGDSYIPSMSMMGTADAPMPSSVYNASGMQIADITVSSASGMQGMEEASSVIGASDSVSSSDGSFLSILSEKLRANEDSILRAMQELGLTADDLTDRANMEALADAMNQGAAQLGVTRIEDILGTVDELMGAIEGILPSDGDSSGVSSLDEEALESAISGAGGSGGGSGSGGSDSETQTEVVTIDGATYLQTTVTENGITTVTRTLISDAPEDSAAASIATV